MKQNIIQKLKEIIMELETEKPDPYAELKAAHAEGKVIECRPKIRSKEWHSVWQECENPMWSDHSDYRIKPEDLKPILTPEQIAEGWIEWHGGENPAPGKRVQYIMRDWNQQCRVDSVDLRWAHFGSVSDIIAYRIIEPKLVPLGPDDVLPGSVLRSGENHWFQVVYVRLEGVNICSPHRNNPIDWDELKKYWQINRSIHLTGKWDASAWEPCSKPESKEAAE